MTLPVQLQSMHSSLSLYNLPNEIIFAISQYLQPYNLTRLAQTSKRFLSLLTGEIDKVAAHYVRRADDTALVWALGNGHISFARRLLERGANPSRRVPGWCSPFEMAVETGDRTLVERCLAAGAQVKGCYALPSAVTFRHTDIVRLLLKDAGNDPHSKHFATALLQAVLRGDVPHLELLLAHLNMGSAEADMIDTQGLLAYAAGEGQEEMVQYLLDRGASPLGSSSLGSDAVSVAHFPVDAPLLYGIFLQNVRVIRMLVHAGADISARRGDGATVLHIAAILPHSKTLVEELLSLGADLSWADNEQRTALDWAKCEEVIKY